MHPQHRWAALQAMKSQLQKETTEMKKGTTEMKQEATEENAVKQELQAEEPPKKKRKLPVAPTQSGNASSGSKDPAVIAPSKKVKQEDEKSWWDTAQYQKQNNAWYDNVKKVTDEGHRSGNLNKLLLLMAQYELGNWDECSRLINV